MRRLVMLVLSMLVVLTVVAVAAPATLSTASVDIDHPFSQRTGVSCGSIGSDFCGWCNLNGHGPIYVCRGVVPNASSKHTVADGSDPMPLCRPSKAHPVCPTMKSKSSDVVAFN